ncbi:MAG TPA: Ig-like domain-containing protein, partial [Tepidisphaeraceae bacterium]|nr:Ig-like domain-containing protein [Tepidisphaeraceae bacterium]
MTMVRAIVLLILIAAFAWWAQGKGVKHRIMVALFGPPARQPKPILVITVQDTEPVDCDGNVSVDAVVRLQIDNRTGPIDPATLTQDSATIIHSASQQRHPARVSLDDDGQTIVLTPEKPLLKDASYSVYVTLGVTSEQNVPLRNFSMAFTTEGSFDPSIRFEQVKQEL